MVYQLLVLIGVEAFLLVCIVAIRIHRERTDVLSGRYFTGDQSGDVLPDMNSERTEREQEDATAQLDGPPPSQFPPPGSEWTRGALWKSWRAFIRDVRSLFPLRARPVPKTHPSTNVLEQGSRPPPALPEGVRVYAVGDIHGRHDLLEGVLAAIDADCKRRPRARPITVFIGDYIDRGPDSRRVLDLLLRWWQGHEAIFLRGNHETFLPRFLADPSSLDEWRRYGGLETLLSYGLKPSINPDRDEQIKLAAELADAVPREHLGFLQALDLTFSCGGFLFVHAGVRPGVPIHEQAETDLLWIREDFLTWERPFEKFIVHGHTPVSEPDLRTNRINIDTGAYATGRLTCIVIENTTISRLTDEVQSDRPFIALSTRVAPDPARA
jgi:serine/threonine protein phosphatase 1